MTKIITWIMANGATILGCLQAIIKALKELLTGVVNLISLFIPDAASKSIVGAIRNALNVVDGWIEWLKTKLLGI